MKNLKYILHSVAVLAVAALATACSSEDELTDNTSDTEKVITITAYQPNTRVGFDKEGNGYWQAGDNIGVWASGDNKCNSFLITAGAGETTASFKGTTSSGDCEYAVYPYNENHKLSGRTLTYYLPDSYTYTSVDQTFIPSEKNGNSFRMPMYGTIANNEVSFKHLGGVICLKIDKMPAESGTVKVISESKKLCGSFTANLSDATPRIITASAAAGIEHCGGTKDNVVSFFYSNAIEGESGTFYLPAAVGIYKLTIIVSSGKLYSSATDSINLERAKLKVVKVNTEYVEDNSKSFNGHKFIDLGLPSGLLWAETNIGATIAADAGNYYAWGETETKEKYTWAKYKYGTKDNLYKYNTTGKMSVLNLDDDAAYVNWGFHCRMPTRAEYQDLCNSCIANYVYETSSSSDSIFGVKFISKKTGNSLFFPQAGFYLGSEMDAFTKENYSRYWTSNNIPTEVSMAYNFYIDKSGSEKYWGFGVGSLTNGCIRCTGNTVRAVAEP